MAIRREKALPPLPGRKNTGADGIDNDESWQSDDDREETIGRNSTEARQEDQALLRETEEHEKLLHKPTRLEVLTDKFRRTEQSHNAGKGGKNSARAAQKAERRRSRGDQTEDGRLMFEMEEGFKDASSISSQDSIEIDRTTWSTSQRLGPKPKGWRIFLIYIASGILFVLFAFGALKASHRHRSKTSLPTRIRSNGTHLFAPTTILISLDGFRADFVDRGITPALNAFIRSGVSPKYMLPSFPSVTFPNHFTLVTGLYPESHGIVGNQFWDPALQEEFYYTNIPISMQPKWWTAEPLWVTAENQGARTAIHMWPGSEAHIPDIEPSFLDKYNGSEILQRKVRRILEWLDLPGDEDVEDAPEKRPQLILSYVPDVDADGHRYGPNSTEILATIANVDSMLLTLVEGLFARNLTEIVNLVIVSDHGMATTSNDRLIQLDDLIDMSLVDHIDGWPLRGLRLKNPDRDVDILYKQLSEKAKEAGTFEVYTLATMPERYHFKNNDRIAPLWVVPKTGWAVVEKIDFDVAHAKANSIQFSPKGLHGYDHEHPLMRAIFVARGPAFPHEPNSRVEPFQNIEVYNIVCDSIGVTPHANNGTIRLPFKTQGLHSDPNAPKIETPQDFDEPKSDADQDSASSSAVIARPIVTSLTAESILTSLEASGTGTSPLAAGRPTNSATTTTSSKPASPSGSPATETPEQGSSWFDFLHDQLEKAKDWAKQFVDSIKGNNPNNPDKPV